MEIKLKVKDETLASVLDAACSGYWVKDLSWPEFTCRDGVGTCWEALLAGDIEYVTVVEDRSEEGKRPVRHPVLRSSIAKALQLMLDKNHGQLGNVLLGYESSETDATTGDVLLQFAALGEERYG